MAKVTIPTPKGDKEVEMPPLTKEMIKRAMREAEKNRSAEQYAHIALDVLYCNDFGLSLSYLRQCYVAACRNHWRDKPVPPDKIEEFRKEGYLPVKLEEVYGRSWRIKRGFCDC
jgi:hypothetical protein